MSYRMKTLRWKAVIAALSYVLGWTVVFAHNVTEEHVVCAEHGDVAHGSASVDEHDEHEEVEAPSGDSLAARGLHDGHEHCAVGPFVRDEQELATLHPTGDLPQFDAPVATLVSTPNEANRPPPVEVLAYAPKTSPPHHV